jgi:DNA-binding transcriptional MerR regulator
MNMKQTDAHALPIREISRLTGVNTVTLRAWERRYGLLKPMRTEKGHRLYSVDDVQRVKDIQSWLVRGLAISKVKAILASDHLDLAESVIDSVWLEYAARVQSALAHLHRHNLEHVLNELIALYPAELIGDQLLAPILEQSRLRQDYGTGTKLAFLHSVVLEQFYFGQYRQRQAAKGKRLLVIKLNADDNDLLPLILNYSLLVNTYQSEYIGYLPAAELVFAVEQLRAEAVVIYGDSASNLTGFVQQLQEWQATLPVPFMLAGKITRMHSLGGEAGAESLIVGDSLQAAIAGVIETLSD